MLAARAAFRSLATATTSASNADLAALSSADTRFAFGVVFGGGQRRLTGGRVGLGRQVVLGAGDLGAGGGELGAFEQLGAGDRLRSGCDFRRFRRVRGVDVGVGAAISSLLAGSASFPAAVLRALAAVTARSRAIFAALAREEAADSVSFRRLVACAPRAVAAAWRAALWAEASSLRWAAAAVRCDLRALAAARRALAAASRAARKVAASVARVVGGGLTRCEAGVGFFLPLRRKRLGPFAPRLRVGGHAVDVRVVLSVDRRGRQIHLVLQTLALCAQDRPGGVGRVDRGTANDGICRNLNHVGIRLQLGDPTAGDARGHREQLFVDERPAGNAGGGHHGPQFAGDPPERLPIRRGAHDDPQHGLGAGGHLLCQRQVLLGSASRFPALLRAGARAR